EGSVLRGSAQKVNLTAFTDPLTSALDLHGITYDTTRPSTLGFVVIRIRQPSDGQNSPAHGIGPREAATTRRRLR
ncbi:hypothetical protein PMAYCL1PPCAC_03711, partial [Pristionchus mayeri]